MAIPGFPFPNPEMLPVGIVPGTIAERVALDTAAASFALTGKLPIGAAVKSIALNIPQTVSATTAVKIGLGRLTATADPDKYWLSADLTATTVQQILSATTVSVTDIEELAIFACATGGTAAGTIGGTGEYIDVLITYEQAVAV